MEAHPIYDKWAPIINAHKSKPGTEIEIRFGRSARGGFDTNVGPQTFKKVLSALERYTGWEDKKHSKSTVYYFDGSKRLTIDDETDEQVGCIKKRVKVDDFVLDGKPLEIQIRTHAMHQVSEVGITAHWRYKEGSKSDREYDAKLAWLRQLMEWQQDVSDAGEFVEGIKLDIFQDQVFVFTPQIGRAHV